MSLAAADVLAAMRAPFPQRDLKSKVQSTSTKGDKGMIVWFVSARAIMDRLDDTVGADNWRDDYEEMSNGVVMCRLSVRIGGEWITKCDVSGRSSQPEEDDKVKAAFSGALKRAAVKFGLGRYLYGVPMQWVEINQYKKPTQEPRMPAAFLPAGEGQKPRPPAPTRPAPSATGETQAPPRQPATTTTTSPTTPPTAAPPSSNPTAGQVAKGQVEEIERLTALACLTGDTLYRKLKEQFNVNSPFELTTDQANRTIAWLNRVVSSVHKEQKSEAGTAA